MARTQKIPATVGLVAAISVAVTGCGATRNAAPAPVPVATTVPSSTVTTEVPVTSDPTTTEHSKGAKSSTFTVTSLAPPVVQPSNGLPALHCPTATVTVHDAAGLQAALDAARPGTVIQLADGIYSGRFSGTGAGTVAAPIWVCGGPMAILDDSGGSKGAAPAQKSGSYGFHLSDASWWKLVGFTVRNAQKGVVLDRSSHNTLHGLTVYNIGDEAIHLRDFSTQNVVEGCVVRATGLRVAKYGEGIYVGTAVKNWGTYSGGQPDASNDNRILYNDLAQTTAENIDIKEGTAGGELAFNTLDGSGLVASAATSWINVKGNGYSVHDNTGANSLGDGFSTHRIVSGAGTGNTFSTNHIGAGVAGYGFAFHSEGNILKCNNTGQGQKGQANVSCTD